MGSSDLVPQVQPAPCSYFCASVILDPGRTGLLRSRSTLVTRCGGSEQAKQPLWDAVTVGSNELVDHGAEPSEGWEGQKLRYPTSAGKNADNGDPAPEPGVPTAIWRKDVHFAAKLFAGKRRFGGNGGIVEIAKFDEMVRVVGFDERASPPAEIARAVGIDAKDVHSYWITRRGRKILNWGILDLKFRAKGGTRPGGTGSEAWVRRRPKSTRKGGEWDVGHE